MRDGVAQSYETAAAANGSKKIKAEMWVSAHKCTDPNTRTRMIARTTHIRISNVQTRILIVVVHKHAK